MSTIAVIIPTRDRSQLLRKTLENILAQTRKPDEIIVVDDRSADDTVEMIKNNFEGMVTVVSNDGKGPGAARNTGFRLSTSDFIQFFDSDDFMTRNKLEVQAGLLDQHQEVDCVYGPYVMAEESSAGWSQLDVIMQYHSLPPRPLHLLVAEGWCAITQSCLFRRSAVERAGPWREDLMPHEDKEYWYRMGKAVRAALHESQTCVFYRQHRNQITDQQVKTLSRTIDGIKAFHLILEQLREDKAPLRSILACRAVVAGYVKYLNDHAHHEYDNSLIDDLLYMGYRVEQKIGRLRTKTNWQPMHGPFNSSEQFQHYRNLLTQNSHTS